LDAIANLYNTVHEAQINTNVTKGLHSAEVEKGVLQLQLLTTRLDFEELNAKMEAILNSKKARSAPWQMFLN